MIFFVNIMQRCHPNYQNMIFCHIDHFCPPTIFTFMKTLWAARVWVISLLILLLLSCNHLFCNCYCYCVIILTYMQTPCAVRVWRILGLLVEFPVKENCQHILKGIVWYIGLFVRDEYDSLTMDDVFKILTLAKLGWSTFFFGNAKISACYCTITYCTIST